ncbi:MAG TPA: hypothetical protein VK625_19180, partial [Flavitalea sp.]|nr:hypothetical protein [Flavitalea sp.]
IGETGIALELVDGGVMDGITVSNIVIEGTECPIYVRLGNRARKHTAGAPEPTFGKMRNILISDITAYNTGNYSSSITGVPGAAIENITLNNIHFVNRGGLKVGEYAGDFTKVTERVKDYPNPTGWGNLPSFGFFIRHVNEITLSNITLRSLEKETRIPVLADDVNNLFISNMQADGAIEKQVQLNKVGTYKRL